MIRTRALRDEQGVALVFMLIMLSVMTMLGLGITGVGMVATTVTVNSNETAGALAIADAGVAHVRRLIMWQEWMSLTPFLQGGDGVGCTGDEAAAAPPTPLPAGYPALPADFIPAAGRAFGGGTYQVFICDDTLTDVDPATGSLDGNPNVDVNKRIIVRSVGVGANGATSTVEQIFGAEDIPAVIVNGNVLAQGNVNFTGAAGAIHGNGSMEVNGNPCAQQYFSAAGNVTTGNSVGGGAGCTSAALDTRPDSPPINVPQLNPDTYKAQADYWMENNGTCYLGATGAAIACAPLGWGYNAGATLWSGGSAIAAGTYWFNSNVRMTGSPGSVAVPLPLTVLARGYVDVSGSPKTTPDLLIAGLGVNPVGVSIMAGTDIEMTGSPAQTFLGLFYAWHQIDIGGTPTINGQVMAANVADTPFPVGSGAANNIVQLNAAGQMVLSGNATINFAGNGVQSVRAQAWRECRTSANPADPCGPLFGG